MRTGLALLLPTLISSSLASVVSTSQRFGVVWTETAASTHSTVRYRGLDLGGKALDPVLTVGPDSHSWASLAEDGQELAVCWAADPGMQARVGFQRFDPSGVLQGGLQDIGGSSYQGVCPALIATSVGWAAVVEGSYALEGGGYAHRYGFALLDPTGAPRGPVEQLIAHDKAGTTPTLVFTGESYFVAYQAASKGILVQRVDGAGHPSGAAELVTQPSRPSYSPRLVWTGTTLVLAYLEQHPEFKDPTVALQVLGPAGTPVGPCVSVTTEDAASVLAASHADGVLNLSWVSARKAMPDRLLLARLDSQGRRLQSDLEIAAAPSGNPPNFVYTSVAGTMPVTIRSPGRRPGIRWFDLMVLPPVSSLGVAPSPWLDRNSWALTHDSVSRALSGAQGPSPGHSPRRQRRGQPRLGRI